MKRFEIDGVGLIIPEDQLNEPLVKSLEEGRYEHGERAAMQRHLRVSDRVLDLGAGSGLVSILAARVVGAANVVAVEASPAMQKALHRNLRRNGASRVRVVSAAVVGQAHEGDEVSFSVRGAFWASSIAESGTESVPAIRFLDLMDIVRPTFVMMDIEGGELALAGQEWPADVRMIVMEEHPALYPPGAGEEMFASLARAGFKRLKPRDKSGIVVLERRPG